MKRSEMLKKLEEVLDGLISTAHADEEWVAQLVLNELEGEDMIKEWDDEDSSLD